MPSYNPEEVFQVFKEFKDQNKRHEVLRLSANPLNAQINKCIQIKANQRQAGYHCR